MSILEEVLDVDLPNVLFDFYSEVKPISRQSYSIQTLKSIRAALDRYFKKTRGIDVVADKRFVKTNKMFKSVTVKAKQQGKGVVKPTCPIEQDDLKVIMDYFSYNHMQKPEPKILQRTLLFYMIYFFYRRGRENLYDMNKDTFRLIQEPDGSEDVVHFMDELDKTMVLMTSNKQMKAKYSQCQVLISFYFIKSKIKCNKEQPKYQASISTFK